MTEAQLKSFASFKELPVFDESDANGNSITAQPHLRECTTIQQVQDCLKDERLVPLGALRARHDGGVVVVAYFAARIAAKPTSS